MFRKEIYAAVEIADHEIRLIVGEFFDTRFNILRVERTMIKGVENKRITNEQDVVNGIRKVVKQANDALGFTIERVLLAIPSVNVERHNKRVNVYPEGGSKRIRLSHIQGGLNEAITYKPNPDLELVNVGCIKYITNGITSRKMPIDESADMMIMDIDLLYADKEIVYSYARCVEKAGLEILDVCLDSYAIAQEAAVFEQTVDKYVVLIDIARQNTTLSLFTHGKLVNCEVLADGYGKWLTSLHDDYHLQEHIGFRLMQNTCNLLDDVVKDNVIYIWSEGGMQKQITEKGVQEAVVPYITSWVETVNEACAPIIESGDVRYLITGEGCEIQSLQQLLPVFNAKATVYVPQTIGARDCSLVTCLGLFYSWKEALNIRKDERISCDMNEMESAVESVTKKSTVDDEGGFTKKLKSILLNNDK
ncbi:cell division protein FtsA [[Eubacterium] hominis]|uniref:cell division protein FtsA n=1 Tax=[Eubacterium] hominis TaxID=2764325 RepID=UPI003A4E4032